MRGREEGLEGVKVILRCKLLEKKDKGKKWKKRKKHKSSVADPKLFVSYPDPPRDKFIRNPDWNADSNTDSDPAPAQNFQK